MTVQQRKAVVLSARVHPGETNASWMMKGFLDFLLGGCREAKVLYLGTKIRVVLRIFFSARQHNAIACYYAMARPFVCPSVFHTAGSVKDG